MVTLQMRRYQGQTQQSSIASEYSGREEQQEKPMMVAIPNARVNKYAMVVRTGNAALADVAMLRPWRLDDVASPADTARVEKSPVVRVERQMVCKIFTSNIPWIHGAGEVEKDVWKHHSHCRRELGEPANLWPSLRKKHEL